MQLRRSVSIVIPAYNEERHLRACLDAIAAQTSPVLEAIVVDNNSTDETAAIARGYPFVRIVQEKQQGIVYARTAGFNAARGAVIARIDADIILPKNWVEYIQHFYSVAENRGNIWTGCGYFYNMRFPRMVTWWYEFFAFRVNWVLIGHYTLWGSNMAMMRTHWQAVQRSVHLRTDIHEDLDLAMHLHEAKLNITYDASLRVMARLKRVRTDRDKLWDYLQWWPNTLKIHRKPGWMLAWFISATVFYGGSYAMVIVEWIARRFGRPALPE
jgi:glycosyltransferase involved in cell wall biosynthesis